MSSFLTKIQSLFTPEQAPQAPLDSPESAFAEWRSARRGERNPEPMNNPFWSYAIREGCSAYKLNEHFSGPGSFDGDPGWCFDRFGRTKTKLPDGRKVFIGGEHEDYYDPDFYIYNDVVVQDGDEFNIYGYPEADFPPTDFATATLVGDAIYLIGNLGYPEDRKIGEIQVLRLDIKTWAMQRLTTTGEKPGWLHKHKAQLSVDAAAVRISGGQIFHKGGFEENIDDYQLCLKTLAWTRLTDRQWQSWKIARSDGESLALWSLRLAATYRAMNQVNESLKALVGEITDRQVALIEDLYLSPFGPEKARTRELLVSDDNDEEEEEEDEEFGDEEYNRYRLEIQGVTVRFDENDQRIAIMIEGPLPAEIVSPLLANVRDRLSEIVKAPCALTRSKDSTAGGTPAIQ